MKLVRRIETTTQGNTQTTFEIPNGTIAWGALIIAIIQALATVLISALGSLITNKPKNDIDKISSHLREQNFKVQLLQRVLVNEKPEDRTNSIHLLLATGLLANSSDEVTGKKFKEMLDSNKIPQWPSQHVLEQLGTYSGFNNSGSFAPGTSNYSKPTDSSSTRPVSSEGVSSR